MKHFITCESVTEGHPDKMCDQISDAVLDACLTQDPYSRVACESLTTTGIIIVAGEITTKANIDYESIVRNVVLDIGYDGDRKYFDGNNCSVVNLLHKQSPNIAQGVDTGGAGDQGIMYGYACNETKSYLPLPMYLAHALAKKLTEVRKNGTLYYLYPDGKTQVTVEYEDQTPIRVDTVVISSQHALDVPQQQIAAGIREYVITPILGDLVDEQTKFFINPTGIFNIGGPKGDSGLTGRKIIVDTYGGIGKHGGGAFSGKDPTKVDRSGAYIARYLAKNIVASGVCERCEIQLGYAIGVIQPVSIYIDCFGTEKVELQNIVDAVKNNFDLSPKGIIEKLDLRKPIFRTTAAYGHFGRDEFTGEKLDSVGVFKKLL
ncbi:MAG: methionine adenosyltransferase [candidate division SR1 bacterium]|nr:methionine adenosyltransferase [candidate division SR1 bacterium]